MIRSRDKGPRLLCLAFLFSYLAMYPWTIPEKKDRLLIQRQIEEKTHWVYVYSASVQQHQPSRPYYY